MAFDRPAALLKLQNLSPLAASLCEPVIANTDNAANWGPAIDSAFLLLGTPYSGLAAAGCPDGKELDAIAIVKMYGLELLAEKLAGSVSNDLSDRGGIKEARSNVLAQIRAQWGSAVNRVEALGYQVERQGSSYGEYALDIYEPRWSGEL